MFTFQKETSISNISSKRHKTSVFIFREKEHIHVYFQKERAHPCLFSERAHPCLFSERKSTSMFIFREKEHTPSLFTFRGEHISVCYQSEKNNNTSLCTFKEKRHIHGYYQKRTHQWLLSISKKGNSNAYSQTAWDANNIDLHNKTTKFPHVTQNTNAHGRGRNC